MFVVYCIYNKKHNKIYIGQTKNIEERLILHNNKTLGGYTSRFNGKWTLMYCEKILSRSEALNREKQLKSYRGREFLKNKINIPL